MNPVVIGWREWISLPALTTHGVVAKIDTGAYRSSLDATRIKIIGTGTDRRVSFRLQFERERDVSYMDCEAPLTAVRLVKNSGGQVEQRPYIKVRCCLGNIDWNMQVSLTDRRKMRYRMLLGRRAVRRRFQVDPGKSFVFGCYQPSPFNRLTQNGGKQ